MSDSVTNSLGKVSCVDPLATYLGVKCTPTLMWVRCLLVLIYWFYQLVFVFVFPNSSTVTLKVSVMNFGGYSIFL